nr:acanthoscurrin-2-like [Cherax quadricarinatus]
MKLLLITVSAALLLGSCRAGGLYARGVISGGHGVGLGGGLGGGFRGVGGGFGGGGFGGGGFGGGGFGGGVGLGHGGIGGGYKGVGGGAIITPAIGGSLAVLLVRASVMAASRVVLVVALWEVLELVLV